MLTLTKPIAFFDLETTGLSIAKDRIVEIAIVKLMPDGSREEKSSYIDPEMPIPEEATAIHNITNEMVKGKPLFKQLAQGIKAFIEGCDIGGYNSNRFDIPVLAEEFIRAGIDIDFSKRNLIDAQHIFYKMEPRSLTAAVKYYCKTELDGAHSALNDTKATVDVFLAQTEMYKESLGHNIDTLLDFIGRDEIVDYARCFVYNDKKEIVFNIGKHKGKKVTDVLKQEPGYYDWMQKSDFTLHTKKKLHEIYSQNAFKK
jgi:DNA polymerase III subunit epsilon